MNVKRMSLRFNMDKESDRIAWEYLESIGESRNKAVINIIRNAAQADKPIAEIIRETISDCLAGVEIKASAHKETKADITEEDKQILEAMRAFNC